MNQGNLQSSDERYGWVMVAVTSIFVGMGVGSMLTVSVFLIPLTTDFDWLRGETAFAYMASSISMGLSGILMGYLSDRFSSRPVVLVGAVGLGCSLLLLAYQTALWQFYLFYCLLGGLGAACFDAPLLANVGSWFDRNKGLAIGVTTAGRALGQGVVPFFASYLISTSGWRGAYTKLGIISLAVLIPLAFLVRTPPGLAKVKAAASKASPSSDLEAYPVKIVPWLSIAAIFCCICMATPLIHVVAMAQDVGIDSKSAASLLLLIYISSFVGRICYGKASDYIGGIRAYMLASASQTVMVFWFTQLNSLTSFYILATLFGLGYSGVMTCLIVCVREMVPVHRRGVSIAIVTLFAWIGMGLGGYQGGLFFDLTGDYTIAYAIAALAGVINLVILGSLRYHITRKEASSAQLKMA